MAGGEAWTLGCWLFERKRWARARWRWRWQFRWEDQQKLLELPKLWKLAELLGPLGLKKRQKR